MAEKEKWIAGAMDTDEFAAGWLRGFFDGEGSVAFKSGFKGKRHTTYYLSVCNTDVSLMAQCVKYLEQLGIEHTRFTESRVSITDKGTLRKGKYTLHICRAGAVRIFAEKVGFASPDKQAILNLMLDWINRNKDDYRRGVGKQVYDFHQQGHSYRQIAEKLGYREGIHNRLADYEELFLEGVR